MSTYTSVTLVPGSVEGRGARYRVRQPGLATSTYRVTDWEPGRSFTWLGRALGVTTRATHTIVDEEGGARLDLALAWEGPLAPVVRLVLSRRAQRMVELEARALADAAAHGRG